MIPIEKLTTGVLAALMHFCQLLKANGLVKLQTTADAEQYRNATARQYIAAHQWSVAIDSQWMVAVSGELQTGLQALGVNELVEQFLREYFETGDANIQLGLFVQDYPEVGCW